MRHFAVLNGPNLDRLGTRQPEIYGSETLDDVNAKLATFGNSLGITLTFHQTNSEAEIIEHVHQAESLDGLIINPGALTHTSRAMADALEALSTPSVEVHISDLSQREPWRRISTIRTAVSHTIGGRGTNGYRDAIRYLHNEVLHPSLKTAYGPHPEQYANVRIPNDPPSGWALLVHGGFWLPQWTHDTTSSLAVDLVKRGLTVANIEYRRSDCGGGWPGSPQDVQTAIRYFASEFGDSPMVVIGHSVGATMSLWLQSQPRMPRAAITVALAPIVDLVSHLRQPSAGHSEIAIALENGAPARIFPSDEVVVIHGEIDREVHPDQSSTTDGAHIIRNEGHFHLLNPASRAWELASAEIQNAIS